MYVSSPTVDESVIVKNKSLAKLRTKFMKLIQGSRYQITRIKYSTPTIFSHHKKKITLVRMYPKSVKKGECESMHPNIDKFFTW